MKTLVKIIFILLLQNIFAQKVINIQADFIYFEDDYLFFYKKEGNMYNKMQLTSRNYYHKPNKLSFRRNLIDADELPQKRISVKKIKKQKINRLIKKTSNQSFFYKDEDDDIYTLKLSKNALYSFNKFGPIFNSSDEIQAKPIDWEFYSQTHLNYCIVNINNERPLIIILGNYKNRRFIEGYLLPFKNFYKIYCNDYEMTTFEKSGIITTTKKELLQKIPLNEIEKDTYEIINNQLIDKVFNKILIPKKFDTLYIDNGLIIGKKNKQIFVYNSELQNIAPKKLKAIYSFNTDLYQVLIKNKIKYLTSKGNLLNELKGLDEEDDVMFDECGFDECGFVSFPYNRKIKIIDGFYTLKTYNLDYTFSKNTKNEFKLFPQSTYDDVLFLTYEKEVFPESTSTYDDDYFIVKKDNKYGMFKYTIDKDKMDINSKYKISLTSIVPLIYDEIEDRIPLLVKKNGLIGYYGINTVLKYKSIGIFDGEFARFTLPNNKKGWLDSNGNEYLDK